MKRNEIIEKLNQSVSEMTDQLIEENIVWDTCRNSVEFSLRLVEDEILNPLDATRINLLRELHEKFSGIINFKPGESGVLQDEVQQYQRYFMILALDSIKKLLIYFNQIVDSKF